MRITAGVIKRVADALTRAAADGITRIAVGAIICRVQKDGIEVLAVERATGQFLAGIEELPGGKVEDGEDVVSALVREIFEETGLTVEAVLAMLSTSDYLSSRGAATRQLNFAVQVRDASLVLDPKEHSGYRWLGREALSGSKFTRNIVELVKRDWPELEELFRQ